MNIVIKNMVCPRCVAAVRRVFEDANIPIDGIALGHVEISDSLTGEQKKDLQQKLADVGFEWLDDKQTRLINAIKSLIVQQVHYETVPTPLNFSTFLSEQLHYDYAYMSRLFSAVEGRTIEKFIIAQKIEKVKELLTYDELTLSQIADQMYYSSSAHLSAQFKKRTGMSPTAFKALQRQGRQFLDEV